MFPWLFHGTTDTSRALHAIKLTKQDVWFDFQTMHPSFNLYSRLYCFEQAGTLHEIHLMMRMKLRAMRVKCWINLNLAGLAYYTYANLYMNGSKQRVLLEQGCGEPWWNTAPLLASLVNTAAQWRTRRGVAQGFVLNLQNVSPALLYTWCSFTAEYASYIFNKHNTTPRVPQWRIDQDARYGSITASVAPADSHTHSIPSL